MDCPTCKTPIAPELVTRAAMSELGKRGRGPKKARPTKQARKAARIGWKLRKQRTGKEAA